MDIKGTKMTTQKILCSLVINIITELEKSNKDIHIEYDKGIFSIYFITKGGQIESQYILHKMNTISDNKDLQREIILKLKGIKK